jgi:predicted phage-related endonuclease
MALSPEQLAAREGKITASFAPQLMAGDEPAIHNKWLELIGDPDWQPEDLGDKWAVQFGSFIEKFALDWHEQKYQHALTRRGEVATHPSRPYVAATLDAFREFDQCVIDCKGCGAWRPLDEIIAHYTPQMVVQKACAPANNAALLVVHGSAEPVELTIHIDAAYEAVVWQRIEQFWDCVQNLKPPVALAPVTPPEQWRTIDLVGQFAEHNWAPDIEVALIDWAANVDSAADFAGAVERIKKFLPEDVGKLTYKELTVSRNRARAVSIKRAKR